LSPPLSSSTKLANPGSPGKVDVKPESERAREFLFKQLIFRFWHPVFPLIFWRLCGKRMARTERNNLEKQVKQH